jgi:hypothetical protein
MAPSLFAPCHFLAEISILVRFRRFFKTKPKSDEKSKKVIISSTFFAPTENGLFPPHLLCEAPHGTFTFCPLSLFG